MDTTWLVLAGTDSSSNGLTAWPLHQGRNTIGRDEGCDIVLLGAHVSRCHAEVIVDDTGLTVRDLASSTGFTVNDEKVAEASLHPGDQLTIACFILQVHETLPRPTLRQAAPRLDPPQPMASSTTGTDKLQDLVDTLRSTANPKELLEQCLLGLVTLLEAERGFVLLNDIDGSTRFVPVASYRLTDGEERAAISRTVCRHAIETDSCLMIDNSASDERCLGAASLAISTKARTIICGPLRSPKGPLGVLYIDRTVADGPSLDDEGRRVFETMTGVAADLVAASRTRQELLAVQSRLEALNTMTLADEQLILGDDQAAEELRGMIAAAAEQDISVLITGETGTGKEMVAKALHRMSRRRGQSFVPVNCAALPQDIIEAELFGAEKGAFTGATAARMGRFEIASGGTLFLDELGELPLDIQVKLLRVLQEQVITRLGGSDPIPLDFRLICATNANLEAQVAEGLFRQDLYFRINVFRLELPPLRKRRTAIMPLAESFLDHFRVRCNREIKGFSREATQALMKHHWPGNIRELRNAVERAVVVEDSKEIQAASLPIGPAAPKLRRSSAGVDDYFSALPINYEEARSQFDERFFQRLLDEHDGNIRAVAREAGIARNTLYRKLERAGLVKKGTKD